MREDVAHAEDLPPRHLRMAGLHSIVAALRGLSDRQNAICGGILNISIFEELFSRKTACLSVARSGKSARGCRAGCRSAPYLPFRIPEPPQPRSAAAEGGLACHQIDIGPEDILHPLLQGDEVEQGEAPRPFEIEKQIDVRAVARLVASGRAEEGEGSHPGAAKLGFVPLQ
jgi:hypothetical protein